MANADTIRLKTLSDALQPARLLRIVDVGANPVEPAPYRSLMDAGLAELWAFEPQEEAYQALLADPLPNTHVLPYAVGNGKTATLRVCAASGFTSLLEPNAEFMKYINRWQHKMKVTERVEVETRKLDDMDEIPSIDLLKIDIQGGELAVFEHGAQKLSDVLAVITEVAALPLYENQPLLDDQMRAMRGLGLDLHKFLFFKAVSLNHGSARHLVGRAVRSQLIDGDAVFVRSLLGLDRMDSEALKRLALLADGTFESVDLTLHVLHLLLDRGDLTEEALTRYVSALPDGMKMMARAV